MRFSFRSSAVLAVAMLAFVAVAPAHSATFTWGAEGFGGFNTHSMSDWNDQIDLANANGSNFDNVKSGFSFGIGPYVMINNAWLISADYERVMPKKTDDSVSGQELDTSANAFLISGGYLFPSQTPMHFGLAGGIGFYSQTGKISDPSQDFDFDGSGVGFHILGLGEYDFSPMVAGALNVGYRSADIDLEKVNGQDASAAGISADYSGLALRVALKVHTTSH